MKNYIKQLIDLFVHNEYSLGTTKKVQTWLSDEEHAEEKEKALQSLWTEAKMQKSPQNMEQSMRRMNSTIGLQTTNRSTKNLQLYFWRVAAIVLFAVSSVSIYLMVGKGNTESDLIESYTPVAEIKELILPDGTSVLINSKSVLLYPDQFKGKTRSVFLIGEANFKVKPDAKHPFIVKTNDYQVTALGTEFNVNAYPESNNLVTTLLEGSVKIEFDNLSKNVILKPNEQLVYNKEKKEFTIELPEVDDVIAWQHGELVFSNMHLEDILNNLERKFDYTFIYSPHSSNKNTYSFRFSEQATLAEIMTIISQVVSGLKYEIKGDKCYIENQK